MPRRKLLSAQASERPALNVFTGELGADRSHGHRREANGERKTEEKKEGQGFRTERFYGSFQRTVSLTAAVDAKKVKASYKDGILKVVLPKAEEAKPKQIEVSVS